MKYGLLKPPGENILTVSKLKKILNDFPDDYIINIAGEENLGMIVHNKEILIDNIDYIIANEEFILSH